MRKSSRVCKKFSRSRSRNGKGRRCIKYSYRTSRSSSRPRRPSHRKLYKPAVGQHGECRSRTLLTCKNDPNCHWDRRAGCKARSQVRRGRKLYQGPIME